MSSEASNTVPTEAPKAVAPSIRAMWPVGVLAVGAAAIVGGAMWGLKTRPKVVMESPLKAVRAMREAGDYESALELLNGKALAYVNLPETEGSQIQEYFLLRARSLHDAQAHAGVSRKENHAAIVSDYEAAEKRGAKLDAADIVRIAEAYLGTDQAERALARVKDLPESEGERRRALLKVIVQRAIRDQGRGGIGANQVLDLLAGFANEPTLSAMDTAWTLARQAELLTGIGLPRDATAKLLREMPLLRPVDRGTMGELYFLLGKAEYESGDQTEAMKQLERAMEMVGPLDPMQASARLMTARVLRGDGQVEEARDRYKEIIKSFRATDEYLPSLLGLASVQAALGNEDESLAAYAELVEQLEQRGAGKGESDVGGVHIDDVAAGLMARHDDQDGADRTREALRYAAMAESLYPAESVPSNMLLAIASSSRKLADQLMGLGREGTRGHGETEALSVDRASRVEARQLYLSAAKYYQRHTLAALVSDVGASARSRWEAADAFDAGGDTESAIKEFTYYAQGASDDDPRRPEAKFRLAQAFQSTGDLKTAASLYKELVETKRTAAAEGGKTPSEAVLWSDRSIVPLARCYSVDEEEANDAEAETLLNGVLSGRDLSPEAPEFRDALIELGAMYYHRGRYVDAAARLAEAEQRFPEDREINTIRYRLADSWRLWAAKIDQALRAAIPQAERMEMEKSRRTRRRDAIRLYGIVRGAIEAKAEAKRTELENVFLRNSMFYQGDCAYDLGDFDAAIGYYDEAKQRYSEQAASLVAMVQIVNAYVQQGEWAKAATANQRAVQHLERFPETVWTQPNLPMEKKHWSRWLDARALLEHRDQAAAGKE